MKKVPLWVVIVSSLACLAAGFVLANRLNRSEIEKLRAGAANTSTAQPANRSDDATLSNEEIDEKLREAEKESGNFEFQRSLGLGLYRYGALRKDKNIIERSIPVLERANGLDAKDYDVLVGLGNAHFDIGYYTKDNQSFQKARDFYAKALEQKPKDIEVRTDVGLTYFLQDPPDYHAATEEFQRSLSIDPKHEKTLQFIIQSLKKEGSDASDYIATLRSVNPKNSVLTEIDAVQGQTK